tara:strand:+ start:1553 stop:2314 length:762 start_codon:yes stop_codon:yes gene_type:complete
MKISLEQFRLGTNKQLIEDSGFKKSPLQTNVQLLGTNTFSSFITIVFNTTDKDIGSIHIKRLVNQFKSVITNQIILSGKTPYQFNCDILPSITTGEYRSDGCFHIHLLISKWSEDDSFNRLFNTKFRKFIWVNIIQKVQFNLDGNSGNSVGSEGRKLKVIDFDFKRVDPKDSRQPIQDYILKTDSDLVHISKSIKTKIKNNNLLVDRILSGRKSIRPSVYKSNVLKVIPNEILERDLKERDDDFLFNMTKEKL